MAKVKFVAVHRIMVKAKPPTYIEPTTEFMMEEKDGEALVRLGAATKPAVVEAEKPAKKAAPAKKTEEPVDGDDDLV